MPLCYDKDANMVMIKILIYIEVPDEDSVFQLTN